MSDNPAPPPRKREEYTGRRVAAGSLRTDEFTYFVVETTTAADRRREKRVRTRLRDGVVKERRVLVDCRIVDRSNVGAKLQLVEDHPLPRTFVLTDPSSRVQYAATLIWQTGREAGVTLTPSS